MKENVHSACVILKNIQYFIPLCRVIARNLFASGIANKAICIVDDRA